MRTLLLSLICFILSMSTYSQRYEWLETFGGRSFTTLNQFSQVHGNKIIVAGEFQNSISFGATVLNATGTSQNIYVACYDTTGNFQWAVNGSSTTGFQEISNIVLDDLGNIYVSGTYSTTVNWGNISLSRSGSSTSSFSREGFLVKLNDSGVAQWIKGIYQTNSSFNFNGVDLLASAGDAVYVGGTYSQSLRVTGSTQILTNTPIGGVSRNNVFIARFNTNGTLEEFENIVTFTNSNATSFPQDIVALDDSSFYYVGSHNGNNNFGSNNRSFTTSSSADIVVAKYTNSNCDWLSPSTSANSFFFFVRTKLAVRQNGNLLLAGNFNSTLQFQNLTINNNSVNGSNFFLGEFSPAGNLEELESYEVNGDLGDLFETESGEVIILGSHTDSVDFNGVKTLTNGGSDMLVLNLDTALSPQWYQTGGGGNFDYAIAGGNVVGSNFYVLGSFSGLSQFGSTFFPGNSSFSNSLLFKMSECGTTPIPLTINGDTNLCQGQSVRIVATPQSANTFQWLRNNAILSGEVFRDVLANSSGDYRVIVNGSGCIDTSRAVPVAVGTPPTVTLTLNDTVCLSQSPLVLTGGNPTGGIYRGRGVSNNTFDPSIAGIGNVAITYVFSNGGCADSAVGNIFVKPAPTLFIAPISPVCINGGPITLSNAFPSGGTFSGPGISGNTFDPLIAGSGDATVTYTFADANGCSSSTTTSIRVDTIEQATFAPLADICINQGSISLTGGLPSGGNYQGLGVSNGTFDPSVVGVGSFQIEYIISNQCGNDTAIQTITVNPLPTVNLSSFNDVCEGSTAITLTGGTPANGTYSGIGVNNGVFDPTISGIGTFTIFYQVTDGKGCSNIDSSTITVNPLPNSSITSDTSICLGESINLTAGGGTNYLWSTGDNTASISVSPTTTTNYLVTVSSASGCSTTENITVTINTLPTASITGPDTVCELSRNTFTASGGTSYLWSNGRTTQSIQITTTATTTYSVTVSNALGCTTVANKTVTANPLPVVNLNNFNDVCEGSAPIALTGGTPANGIYIGTGVVNGIFDPARSGIGTFTIFYQVTDGNGCTDSDFATIRVNPLPNSSVTNDTSICQGESINLIASGGTNYLWSTGDNTASISVNPTTTTNYSVTISTASGCSATENVTVTVNSLPTASITGNTTICNGENTTLTANGGSSYLWSTGSTSQSITITPSTTTNYSVTVSNTLGCSAAMSSTVTVNPLPFVNLGNFNDVCEGSTAIALSGGTPANGTYSGVGVNNGNFDPTTSGTGTFTIFYQVIDGNGCSNVDSSTITVNPLPNSSITKDTSICLGEAINLTAGGGTNYLWSTGDNIASISVNPTTTTNYSVTINSASGCSTTENVTVTVNTLPVANITGNDVVCEGIGTTLTANGGSAYLWSTGSTTQSIQVSPNATTNYSVTVSNTSSCTSVATSTVIVNPLPNVSLASIPDVCEGSSSFTLNTGTPANGIYSGAGVNNGSFDPIVTGPGTFKVFYQVTNANGCSNIDSNFVTVTSLPNLTVSNDTSICEGTNAIISANGGTSYTWRIGNTVSNFTTPSITVNPSTTTQYNVSTTNAGCTVEDSILVTVNTAPTVIASNDTSICLGDSVSLTVSGSALSYSWNTGMMTNNIRVAPLSSRLFIASGISGDGCITSDSVLVTINTGSPINIGRDTTLSNSNNSVTFDAGAGFSSYLWNDGSTNQTLTVNYDPAKSGTTETYFVIVGNTSGCSSIDSALVSYDISVSLQEIDDENQAVVLYPNPTRDQVNIRFEKKEKENRLIELFNTSGKLVFNQSVDGSQEEVKIHLGENGLAKGVYYVRVNTSNSQISKKLIIQ